jgi:hypothetical protein
LGHTYPNRSGENLEINAASASWLVAMRARTKCAKPLISSLLFALFIVTKDIDAGAPARVNVCAGTRLRSGPH